MRLRATVLLALLAILTPVASAAEAPSLLISSIYRLDELGVATVTIEVSGENPVVVELPLEPGYEPESIIVYGHDGLPLDYDIVNNTLIVYAGNATRLTVEYTALLGRQADGIVEATIHPPGPATVYLPRGAALAGFTGEPAIDYSSGRIVLRYSGPGEYAIDYVPSAPPSTVPQKAGGIEAQTTSEKETSRDTNSNTPIIAALAAAGASTAGAAILFRRKRSGKSSSSAVTDVVIVADSTLDERDRAILELLRSRGPMGVSDVARSLGISKSTAWRKLQKLVNMGLVERIAVDGSPLYRVKESSQKED